MNCPVCVMLGYTDYPEANWLTVADFDGAIIRVHSCSTHRSSIVLLMQHDGGKVLVQLDNSPVTFPKVVHA